LGGSFAPAALHVELPHRADAITAGPEGFEGFIQANAQRTHCAGADHGNPSICHARSVKCHGLCDFLSRNSLLISQPKHFTNDPETENESLEVGRLSVEFIQRRFNP
jgi:hypothetical protein